MKARSSDNQNKNDKADQNVERNIQARDKEETELRGERAYIDMSSQPSEGAPEIADRGNLLYDETAGEAFSGDAMGEQAGVNPESDINSFEDPLEADINERLKLGFALERPEQGDLGEEDEYIGDLPDGQLRMGNRYDPAVSTGNPGGTGLEMPGDMEIHLEDESHIGMAYGPDNYVNDEDDDEDEFDDLNRGDEDDDIDMSSDAKNQSIH
jgi:hypothetical protein